MSPEHPLAANRTRSKGRKRAPECGDSSVISWIQFSLTWYLERPPVTARYAFFDVCSRAVACTDAEPSPYRALPWGMSDTVFNLAQLATWDQARDCAGKLSAGPM